MPHAPGGLPTCAWSTLFYKAAMSCCTSVVAAPALGSFRLGAFRSSHWLFSVSGLAEACLTEEQIHDGCYLWLRGGCVTTTLQPAHCSQEVTNNSAFGAVTVPFYVSQASHRAQHIKQSAEQIRPRSAVAHTADKDSKLLGKLCVWPYPALGFSWLAEGSDTPTRTAVCSLLGGWCQATGIPPLELMNSLGNLWVTLNIL